MNEEYETSAFGSNDMSNNYFKDNLKNAGVAPVVPKKGPTFDITSALGAANKYSGYDYANTEQFNKDLLAIADPKERTQFLKNKTQFDAINAGPDYMGMAGVGMSAFNAYNNYQANKTNQKLANAQIGSLESNIANKNAFLSGTKSAFA